MNNNALEYGYVGKIARINLTDQTVIDVPTSDYAPEFIGGRAIGNKIFWDEVGPGVGPFDPENKVVFMTGATCGTGIPTGDRTSMVSISPNNMPEQYCWGNIGGWFAVRLKYAGYDGFILEGCSKNPIILVIDDGEVRFEPANDIWGMYVHDAQNAIKDRFGEKFTSMVIGPAGENLVRIASITTSNDNAFAKAGFGAVFGSKKLKGIAVFGTGSVTPAHIDDVLRLRKTAGDPVKKLNPIAVEHEFFFPPYTMTITMPEGTVRKMAHVACCSGCTHRCAGLHVDVASDFKADGRTVNMVDKCVNAVMLMKDCGWPPTMSVHTKMSFHPDCCAMSDTMPPDTGEEDPDWIPELDVMHWGNNLNLYDWDYDRMNRINHACAMYGIDRWDICVWLISWLVMGKRTGVLGEDDFWGMSLDPLDTDLIIRLMHDMTYREGKWGELLAEGMGRMIEKLGVEKYGNTEYRFASNVVPGLELSIPISWASAWGHSFHWQGRGFEGSTDLVNWIPVTLMLMVNTRDAQTNGHLHMDVKDWQKAKQDPYHNPLLPQFAFHAELKAEMKESVATCERMSPNIYWPELETEMYNAATGLDFTMEELEAAALRSMTLFRAIEIRNHQRTREMEVKEVYRPLQYPDPEGITTTWEEFNDVVDLYYDLRGWDRATGWPTRETYEKYGLGYVADEMDELGLLP